MSKQYKHMVFEKYKILRASKKANEQQQYREQRLIKPRGWQVRWGLNILRCDYNRSPSSMCSQTAGAHRHEPPATYSCTCRTKCGGGKFSGVTQACFWHEHHTSHTCPQRLFDPLRVLLMLLPFGTPCTMSANEGIFTKTPSMTLSSMFACDMCKTRAQNTY